jgi:cyclophilin family peptidyl-prolyl cis-trans isomerase
MKAEVEPNGPTVVMDTSLGRVTCKLYSKLAPVTVANFVGLVSGTKAWTDPMTGKVVQGKGFYDGVALNGMSDGMIAGDRMGGGKGVMPSFSAEKTGLGYERGGRLAMAKGDAAGTESGSLFYVTAHPDMEYERRGGVVFGQCDAASQAVVAAVSHALLSVDNHPEKPVAVNRMLVVQAGESLPAVAAEVPAAQVTPQPAPTPVASLPAPEPMGGRVAIETSKGTMTCRLFEETPVATKNFIGLATGTKEWKSPLTGAVMKGKPYYAGLHFGRVIPDFMVQNADVPGGSGKGDTVAKFGVETVPGLSFDRPGRLAYANSGPETNTSEFFVTEHAVRRLDGLYTIFGQCDASSVGVVEAMARVPRDEHNKPVVPVVIKRVVVGP